MWLRDKIFCQRFCHPGENIVKRWRRGVLIGAFALVFILSLFAARVEAAGLSYREIVRFTTVDARPYIIKPETIVDKWLSDLPTDQAVSLDFSADGKTLAVGYRGAVRLWDIATVSIIWERSLKIQPYQGENSNDFFPLGSQVRYSPDGQLLAFTAFDEVQVYRGNTLIQRCGTFQDVPISWSADDRYIAGGNKYGDLLICDVQTGTIRRYKGFYVSATEWSPDGKHIAVLSDTRGRTDYLRIIDSETGVLKYTVSGYYSVSWRPDSQEFISNAWNSSTVLRSASNGDSRLVLNGISQSLAWHPKAERIAHLSFSYSQNVEIKSTLSDQRLATVSLNTKVMYTTMSEHGKLRWSRDGSKLAVIDTARSVHIFQENGKQSPLPSTLTPVLTSTPIQNPVATWTPTAPPVRRTAKSVLPSKISGKRNGTIDIPPIVSRQNPPFRVNQYTVDFEVASSRWVIYLSSRPDKRHTILRGTWLEITDPIISHDGRYLAYTYSLANVHILDLQTFQIVHTIRHRYQVTITLWHSTKPLLATLNDDYLMRTLPPLLNVFDLQTRKEIYREDIFLGLGPQLRWIDDSDTLLIWSVDNKPIFLNVHTQTPLKFNEKHAMVLAGAPSPDRQYYVFAIHPYEDATLYFVDVQKRAVVARFANLGEFGGLQWSADGQEVWVWDGKDTITVLGN
jgi:Tol biopolymer transport system component